VEKVLKNLLMNIILGFRVSFHVSLLVGNGLNMFQVETIQVITLITFET